MKRIMKTCFCLINVLKLQSPTEEMEYASCLTKLLGVMEAHTMRLIVNFSLYSEYEYREKFPGVCHGRSFFNNSHQQDNPHCYHLMILSNFSCLLGNWPLEKKRLSPSDGDVFHIFQWTQENGRFQVDWRSSLRTRLTCSRERRQNHRVLPTPARSIKSTRLLT
jgi:hypothetical protein